MMASVGLRLLVSVAVLVAIGSVVLRLVVGRRGRLVGRVDRLVVRAVRVGQRRGMQRGMVGRLRGNVRRGLIGSAAV